MLGGLITWAGFKLYGLPIIQSVIASGIFEYLKDECILPSDKLTLSFDESVQEALCRAIKLYKNVDSEAAEKDSKQEIRYYLKVLKDELINLEPVERKTYIEKNLYRYFKEEVKKSPTAIRHLSMDVMRECNRAQKDVLAALSDIKPIVEHTLVNTEKILDKADDIQSQIDTISSTLSKLVVNKQFDFNILSDEKIDLICPIPMKVALRSDLVAQCKQILDTHHVLHIYGTFKCGKSVLACLTAQKYDGYKKFRIDLEDKSPFSIDSFLQSIELEGKKIIIIDRLKLEDSDSVDRLCRSIKQYASVDTLIIIASCTAFSSINFDKTSLIPEIESTNLTSDDVVSLFDAKYDKWGGLIHGITAGSPQLVQLALNYVESHDYKLSDKELYDLFTFEGGMDISSQCRKVLSRMLPDSDSLRLLNRLLLLGPSFTKEECEIVASIEPLIENPLTHVANLLGTWIKQNGGKYEIAPLIRKALKPDMPIYAKRDCCNAIADNIVRSCRMSSTDVLRVITLYISAGAYDKVVELYIGTLTYLQENNALNSEFAKLIRGLWHGLLLPKDMPIRDKISIRTVQLALFGISSSGEYDLEAQELQDLLDESSPTDSMASSDIYCLISNYYLISGNVVKHQELSGKVSSSDAPKMLAEKISPNEIQLIQLSKVNDITNLYALMESQSKQDFHLFDMYVDGVNCAINNILTSLSNNSQKKEFLGKIIAKARDLGVRNLYPFAISALARMMQINSTEKNLEEVVHLYNDNQDLLDYDLGRLQMNFAYAVALEENGEKDTACTYFEKAADIRDLSISSTISLHSNLSAACYIGQTDAQGAVDRLCYFMKLPGLHKYLLGNQLMLFYGSLSIAYWFNNQKVEAIRINNIITDYIWRNRANGDDAYKDLVIRQGLMLTQFFNRESHGEDLSDNIPLMYNLFTTSIRDIYELYADSRIYGVLVLTSTLNDIIQGNDDVTFEYTQKAIQFSKIADSSVAGVMGIMTSAIPLLLQKESLDSIEYLMETTASSLRRGKDVPEGIDETFLYNALLHIACWRLTKHNIGEYVDDDSIKEIIARYASAINKQEMGSNVVNSLFDVPDYEGMVNDILKTVCYVWHMQEYSSSDVVIIMHRVFVILSKNWKQASMTRSLNNMLVSTLNYRMQHDSSAFDNDSNLAKNLINRAYKHKDYECAHKLIVAYNYLLKKQPEVHGDLEEFLYP